MLSLNKSLIVHWLETHATLLAVLVTAAVALLLICCVECSTCRARDKDEIFKRREL